MRMGVKAGDLAGPPCFPKLLAFFLVLLSLGFSSLGQLVYPPASSCIFPRPGFCQGRSFPTVPWGGSLGLLYEPSVQGWRAFVQDLPGSSSGAFFPSFSAFHIPSTWHRLLPAPFLAIPLLPSFWRHLVKLLVKLGLGSFLSLSVLGTVIPDFLGSRKGTHRLLLDEFIPIG